MVKSRNHQLRPIISINGLTKKYDNVSVVKNLNLDIQNSCFALLGPNGAGKTTTLLMLLGLIKPTEGKAFIFGEDIIKNSVAIRESSGFLPENVGFNSNKTGREHLELMYRLKTEFYSVKNPIESLMKWCGLNPKFWDKKIKTYSQGMRQRLGLAIAFAGNPKIVFLDEPLSNIDPIGRVEIISKIKEKQREGITIIISSHIILEVEKIIDSIAIIDNGILKVSDNILRLASKLGFNEFEIFYNNKTRNSEEVQELDKILSNRKDLILDKPTLLSDRMIIKTDYPNEIEKILEKFLEFELRPISGTLDKIYRKIITRVD